MPPVLARQAWVDMAPCSLASRELMILEFLLGHMTLQRKELEGEMWFVPDYAHERTSYRTTCAEQQKSQTVSSSGS